MSLFQCENCGCCENTALASQGFPDAIADCFDWTGLEAIKGKKLCSACGPTKHADGSPTEYGKWHGIFERVYLPLGMFKTARNGNLAHIETGDENFRQYAIKVKPDK